MTSSMLFNATTFLFLISTILFIAFLATRNNSIGLGASTSAFLGLGVETVAILLRWKESYDMGHGHAPLSNLYESVTFFAWTIVLMYGIIEIKYKYRVVGAFVLPFAMLGMAWAQLGLNSGIEPLVPALQSNWLLYHVVTCFLGYAAFAVACGISIMYLIRAKQEEASGNSPAGGIIAM